MLPRSVFLSLSLSLALSAGCSGTEKCRVGSDCASGICLSNGECGRRNYPDADLPIDWPDTGVPAPDAAQPAGDDASTPDETDGSVAEEADGSVAELADAGAGADAATDVPADAAISAPDAGPLPPCQADHDGVITKDALPVVLGAKATFLVARNVTVNTVGTQQTDGTFVWDLSGALNGDEEVEFSPTSIAGQWFEPGFPGAEFTLRMAGGAETLGVLQGTVDGLLLHGMADPVESATATNVKYLKDDFSGDPGPVVSVAYPVQTGATWTSAGILEGDYDGDYYHCDSLGGMACEPYPNCCIKHVYTSTADKVGKVVTPLGTFDVVRIKNVVDFYVYLCFVWGNGTTCATGVLGAVPFKTLRSYAFVSECFGTVASIVAQDGETEEEFTTAAEVRRLAP